MKVIELTGALLDYWVARAEGLPLSCDWYQGDYILVGTGAGDLERFEPSSDWSDGGPIIERECGTFTAYYGLNETLTHYTADMGVGMNRYRMPGPTHLVAAMRAYVASKFGEQLPTTQPEGGREHG